MAAFVIILGNYPRYFHAKVVPNHAWTDRSQTFHYYSDGSTGFIILSVGPDGLLNARDLDSLEGNWADPEFERFRYDPTNGSASGGDVFRTWAP